MAETKVDVLAVMDEANSALHNTCSVMGENRWTEERLAEARAAVAELIAALDEQRALPTYVTLNYAQDGEGDGPAWWSRRRAELESAGYSFARENYNGTEDYILAGNSDRVDAALARCKGEQA